MSQPAIGYCPVCKNQLIATKLSCKHCGLELSNEFSLNKFTYLNNEEFQFVETFLQASGNLKNVQKQLNLSYPAAKKLLSEIQTKLQLKAAPSKKKGIEVVVTQLPLYQDESKTVRKIKEKLNFFHGLAEVPLSRGNSFHIYYEEFGNGVFATNLPQNKLLTWKSFDCAIEVLLKNGGRADKGHAMKAKLGEPALSLDTVEGYVAYHAFGVKNGESTLRTITALSSILEWAEICINGYGYLQLKN